MKFFFSQVKRELLYKLRKKWSRRQWPNLPQPKCLFLREPGGVEEAAQVTAPQRTPKLRHQLQVQNAFCLISRVSTTGTRNLLDELIMSPGLFRPGSKWCFGHNMLPPIFSYLYRRWLHFQLLMSSSSGSFSSVTALANICQMNNIWCEYLLFQSRRVRVSWVSQRRTNAQVHQGNINSDRKQELQEANMPSRGKKVRSISW